MVSVAAGDVSEIEFDLNNQNPVTVLPEDLNKVSWGGSLPKKVWQRNKRLIIIIYALVLVVASMAALVAFALTGNPQHLYLVIPGTTWLGSFGIWIAEVVSTREVRVLRPGSDGEYILDIQKWHNRDMPFKESDAKYEGDGRRVLWVIWQGDRYNPFDPRKYKLKNPSKVTAAQVAGIEGYRESVKEYAFKKNMTVVEQLRLGMLVIAIVALLFGIYVMSGRLRDGDRQFNTPDGNRPTPEAGTGEAVGSSTLTSDYGSRDLRT